MKFTLTNSHCYIKGSAEEQEWLEHRLTVGTKTAFKRPEVFFKFGDRCFPVGLLHLVIAAAPPFDIDIVDEREKLELPTEPKQLEGINYYGFQEEAVRLMLRKKQGLVKIATNGGKTVSAIGMLKTIEETGYRGIILVHRDEILEQWYEEMKEHLESVGRLVSKNAVVAGKQFVVCMGRTLLNRLGDDKHVTKLFDEHKVLLADECHHLKSGGWMRLFRMSNARVKLGMSGTIPDETTVDGMKVRAYTGKVLIEVPNIDLIEAGISAVPKVQLHKVNSKAMLKGLYKECMAHWISENGPLFDRRDRSKWISSYTKTRFFGYYSKSVIEKAILRNPFRNKLIADLVILNREKQNLVIVERLEHGEALQKLIEACGIEVGFAHGTAKKRTKLVRDFKNGKLKVLIATTILDEGVDISGIDHLVLCGGMKSTRAILQRVGRGLRKKKKGANVVLITDFLDKGSKYLEEYSKKRMALYLTEGFDVEIIK